MMGFKIENLSFAYEEKRVLENVNLQIERGSFVGILGANGSGKNTLLRILSACLKPQKGCVY